MNSDMQNIYGCIFPAHEGKWSLTHEDHTSIFNVWMRKDWPVKGMTFPFASNEIQTDPCSWLDGEWKFLE